MSQQDSTLIAKWWNIQEPDDAASQSAHRTFQTTGSVSMGASESADRASLGAWSYEKPMIEHDGVKIDRLAPNGPADAVGVQVGDYILALGGVHVFTVEELMQNMQRYQPWLSGRIAW